MPHVLVTGATGFLGRAVTARFLNAGWRVTAFSRTPGAGAIVSWENIPRDLDAVVHLAGESIAGGRWTRARKQKLMDSRVAFTRRLIQAIYAGSGQTQASPPVFASASGMGYHGDRGSEPVQAGDPPGGDFLGQMAAAWEREALAAESFGARAVVLRLGMVLGNSDGAGGIARGGALGPLRLAFRLGLGAVLGTGRQYWPWIHREDAAELFFRAVTDPALRGPLHAAAGEPVTQREFAGILAGVLRRPLLFRVPVWALRFAMGEMADLFLHGQRVRPDPRFSFRHGTLEGALRNLCGRAEPG